MDLAREMLSVSVIPTFLVDKAYTDEGALQDATREGLQSPPALPAALVDKILKAFGQSGGELYV